MKTIYERIISVLTLSCIVLLSFLGFGVILDTENSNIKILADDISEEIILDEASLPEDWRLTNTITVPGDKLPGFSVKLNGEITAIYNYIINCDGIDLQVNVLTAENNEEASKIYEKLLTMKNEEYLQVKNDMVVEYISQNLAAIKKAKEILLFNRLNPEEVLDTPEGRYLNNNHLKLKVDNNRIKGLKLREDSLAGKKLFITAEVHGVVVNQLLEYEFLRYFREKTGVRYYLQELPYSTSMLLNMYLKTGDKGILKKIYQPLKGTYEWTEEKYRLWQKIYEYNQTLSPENRIIVLGFDIEHQMENAFCYLNTILPENSAPEVLKPFIQEIKSIHKDNRYNHRDIKDFALSLQENIKEHKKIYKDYLGDDYFGFTLVCDNIINRYTAYEKRNKNWNSTRDAMMYDNFLRIYSYYPEGRYYGQWGLNHAFQGKQGGVNWFASLLDNDQGSPLKGKILSIVYLYKDCQSISNGNYKTYSLTNYVSVYKVMDTINEKNITLFSLERDNSPYSDSLNWMLSVEKPESGVTADYFQYAVLLEGFGPSTPLY